MNTPTHYDFTRYLAAKRSVDDRSLNRRVFQTLQAAIERSTIHTPLKVLEIGAGTGTMIERLLEWDFVCHADYTALDVSTANILEAGRRLPEWARAGGYRVGWESSGKLRIENERQSLLLNIESIDLFDFVERETDRRCWDLLTAHAFLDLIDIPSALPRLFRLLRPGGLFYFTIVFDGETVLEPGIDPDFEVQIMTAYHRTMDERVVDGRPSGDSRSGRHLFTHLVQNRAMLLSAGASDWVVYPRDGGYPNDEAYFLHFILHTIHTALTGCPELDPVRFERWVAARHAQVERGELVYLAHQLDFAGQIGLEQAIHAPRT